jgi:hypothetical protein
MCDVPPRAGVEIINAQHFIALRKESFAKMRTDKSGSSRDSNPISMQ